MIDTSSQHYQFRDKNSQIFGKIPKPPVILAHYLILNKKRMATEEVYQPTISQTCYQKLHENEKFSRGVVVARFPIILCHH